MVHDNAMARAEASADARQRALRTLVQGVATDALIAVVLAVQTIVVAGVEWSGAYWSALGLLVAKTLVQSVVSAIARRVVPPATL